MNALFVLVSALVIFNSPLYGFIKKKPSPPATAPIFSPAPAPAPATIPAGLTGNFNLILGYTSGSKSGLFGYGTATVSSTGIVSTSHYLPYTRTSCYNSGIMTSSGLFSLDGVSGTVTIYDNKLGYGYFSEPSGAGIFGVSR